MDEAKVDRLSRDLVDGQYRGFPTAAWGRPIADLTARAPELLGGGFTTPIAVLHEDAVEHNIRAMAAHCRRHGVELAPHGKTTMAPQLFARQLRHGAWGITAATIDQIRLMRSFGVGRVVLANQLVDPTSLAWIAAELAADESFGFVCWVDSVRGVRLMDDALERAGHDVVIDVLVEAGARGGRTGCRSLEELDEVAVAATASRHLRPVGVSAFEGVLGGDGSPETLERLAGLMRFVRQGTEALLSRGLLSTLDGAYLVSAGGSAYFDQVIDVLGRPWGSTPVRLLLRSGCYVTHDSAHYAGLVPSTRRLDPQPALRAALQVFGRVLSRPEPDLCIADVGKRDLSHDVRLPVVEGVWSPSGVELPAFGLAVERLSDQHAFIRGEGEVPDVGDWVALGIAHPCTTFDKWRRIAVVDAQLRVVDCLHTYF